jgi:hypothetical protein
VAVKTTAKITKKLHEPAAVVQTKPMYHQLLQILHADKSSTNETILSVLQRLSDIYILKGEPMKNLAYEKAIASIRMQNAPIKSEQDVPPGG